MVCEEKGDVLSAGATDGIWPSKREFSLSLSLLGFFCCHGNE
jgi:hypothetical protein